MKSLKALVSVALVSSMLVGCGTGTSSKTKKVGIIQLVDHTSLNTIKKAFDGEMKKLGYKDGDNIEYTFKNGQGDSNTLASIANDFQGRIWMLL